AADGDVAGYNVALFQTAYLHLTGVGGLHELVSDESGALWDEDAALEAARCVEQIVQGGYLVPGYDASKWPAQQQTWATNEAALLLNGSWIPTETAPYASEGFEYSSFPIPSPAPTQEKSMRAEPTGVAIPARAQNPEAAAGSAAVLLRPGYQERSALEAGQLPHRPWSEPTQEKIMRAEPTGFAIPARAKNPEAAAEFAKFLLRQEYQEKIALEGGQLPIREGIETIPELAAISASIDEADNTYLAADGIS